SIQFQATERKCLPISLSLLYNIHSYISASFPRSTMNPSTNPSETGRTNSGQFAKGNRCGRGNPFARKVASFRAAIINTTTAGELAQMANILKQQALGGDKQAIKLYFQYTVGRPADASKVDPDRVDVD